MPLRRHWPSALLAVLVAIPLVPIAIGATLGGALPPASASAKPLSLTALAPTPATAPAKTVQAPPGTTPVARVLHPTELRISPGGKVLAPMAIRTHFGSPTYLAVVKEVPGWLGVLSSAAGNSGVGWIPTSSAQLSTTNWAIRVSLSAHTVTVLRARHPVAEYVAAVGSVQNATPTGHFAVTDRLRTGDSTGAYGCCILALTATAPHPIENWSGGNRVAIHSTPETSSLGHSVSHGCVRVSLAAGRWLLAHVPLGALVVIRT